jgi:hypothetical protein
MEIVNLFWRIVLDSSKEICTCGKEKNFENA